VERVEQLSAVQNKLAQVPNDARESKNMRKEGALMANVTLSFSHLTWFTRQGDF